MAVGEGVGVQGAELKTVGAAAEVDPPLIPVAHRVSIWGTWVPFVIPPPPQALMSKALIHKIRIRMIPWRNIFLERISNLLFKRNWQVMTVLWDPVNRSGYEIVSQVGQAGAIGRHDVDPVLGDKSDVLTIRG